MATSTGSPIHGNSSTTDQKFTFDKNVLEGVTVSRNRPSYGVFRIKERLLTSPNNEIIVSQDDRGSTLFAESSISVDLNVVVCDRILEKDGKDEEIEIINNSGQVLTIQNPANATDLAGLVEEDVEFFGRADNGTNIVSIGPEQDVEVQAGGIVELTSLGYREGDTGSGETERVWQVHLDGDLEFTP